MSVYLFAIFVPHYQRSCECLFICYFFVPHSVTQINSLERLWPTGFPLHWSDTGFEHAAGL